MIEAILTRRALAETHLTHSNTHRRCRCRCRQIRQLAACFLSYIYHAACAFRVSHVGLLQAVRFGKLGAVATLGVSKCEWSDSVPDHSFVLQAFGHER